MTPEMNKYKRAFETLDCTVSVQSTRSPDWVRMFIVNKDGISIGRVNFQNGEVYNIKSYKRSYHDEIDETDYVMMRLPILLDHGVLIDREQMHGLWLNSLVERDVDLEKKKQWRRENPSRTGRPKLHGKNPRHILSMKMHELYEELSSAKADA